METFTKGHDVLLVSDPRDHSCSHSRTVGFLPPRQLPLGNLLIFFWLALKEDRGKQNIRGSLCFFLGKTIKVNSTFTSAEETLSESLAAIFQYFVCLSLAWCLLSLASFPELFTKTFEKQGSQPQDHLDSGQPRHISFSRLFHFVLRSQKSRAFIRVK